MFWRGEKNSINREEGGEQQRTCWCVNCLIAGIIHFIAHKDIGASEKEIHEFPSKSSLCWCSRSNVSVFFISNHPSVTNAMK